MKVYTREQLIKRLKICVVIGLIASVAFMILGVSPMLSTSESRTIGDVLLVAAYFVGAAILFPISLLAMSFNFGRMMLGMIAPIPILSYFIEFFKAYVYAIKALIVIFKRDEKLVIASSKKSKEEAAE